MFKWSNAFKIFVRLLFMSFGLFLFLGIFSQVLSSICLRESYAIIPWADAIIIICGIMGGLIVFLCIRDIIKITNGTK